MKGAILPGSTVGVLGSGQLGRMFAIAARQMGYRVHTFSPDDDTPTGQVADVEVAASYDDLDRVRDFARAVSVVTFEFENVPAATAAAAAAVVPVRPSGAVLHTTQNRLREKSFLAAHRFPVARYAEVRSEAELVAALEKIPPPAVLKTAGWGYDGKGQTRIASRHEAALAWSSLATDEAVLEAHVDFAKEVSVVAARGLDGTFTHWGVIENEHTRSILDVSMAPAVVSQKVWNRAIEIAREIVERLELVGVLCVEFFVTRDDELLVNEIAPRPHNSGHFTIDACVTSQFEQQLRAICGLSLGSTERWRPAAMANLLGDLWERAEPRWEAACEVPHLKLHLYGKLTPRPGRKMGHLTVLGPSAEAARGEALQARHRLVASG